MTEQTDDFAKILKEKKEVTRDILRLLRNRRKLRLDDLKEWASRQYGRGTQVA